MTVEPRRLQGVADARGESLGWQLSEDEWREVRAVLDRLAGAVTADDAAGVEKARADLADLDPRRRIVRARFEPTPMPEDLRERQNMIVHEIEVRVPGGRATPDEDTRQGE